MFKPGVTLGAADGLIKESPSLPLWRTFVSWLIHRDVPGAAPGESRQRVPMCVRELNVHMQIYS